MRTSIQLDDDLVGQINELVSAVGEKPATILRLAIRAGLPRVREQFQESPAPAGFFADAYTDYPQERLDLEEATSRTPTGPNA